ncbi:MAG: hypothetical protein AABZ12_09980 [Planctomycetota bacterium]
MNWKQVGVVLIASLCIRSSRADDLRYEYEGNVLPYDSAAGWVIANPCEDECSEALSDGRFVLAWATGSDIVMYRYDVSTQGTPVPPTLWVEWQFRSNHAIGRSAYTCDAICTVIYRSMHVVAFLYGDAAVSFDGGSFVRVFGIDEFHTVRYESDDGLHYSMAIDGRIFDSGVGDDQYPMTAISIGGIGGCVGDENPNNVNEWDFVRYGTIAYGEEIIESDPAQGFVDARIHALLDRFTVRYDSPNYVYLDEISVETTSGVTPVVTKTRRLDNGPPDVVEIVLDRPIPYNATTRFTFDDGVGVNVVEFTFAPGDTDGDGDADLSDFAAYQNCLGTNPLVGGCLPLDVIADGQLRSADFAKFISVSSGP